MLGCNIEVSPLMCEMMDGRRVAFFTRDDTNAPPSYKQTPPQTKRSKPKYVLNYVTIHYLISPFKRDCFTSVLHLEIDHRHRRTKRELLQSPLSLYTPTCSDQPSYPSSSSSNSSVRYTQPPPSVGGKQSASSSTAGVKNAVFKTRPKRVLQFPNHPKNVLRLHQMMTRPILSSRKSAIMEEHRHRTRNTWAKSR